MKNLVNLLVPIIPCCLSALMAAEGTAPAGGTGSQASGRIVLDFAAAQALAQWQAVNDDIMGGESTGAASITPEQHLLFTGKLSLDNNGGFVSLRSKSQPLGLTKDSIIVLRVRGDGRAYTVTLWTKGPLKNYVESAQKNETGMEDLLNYRAGLPTKKGEWQDIELPVSIFKANLMGQELPSAGLEKPETIVSLGLGLSDHQAGPFQLEVAWFKVRGKAPVAPAR
ncbi:CIA30 family protein [Planctomycetota bacterium]|nr:CIA30 family protein [Planctomycetota bacterium]